jgi:hypothetical protein
MSEMLLMQWGFRTHTRLATGLGFDSALIVKESCISLQKGMVVFARLLLRRNWSRIDRIFLRILT